MPISLTKNNEKLKRKLRNWIKKFVCNHRYIDSNLFIAKSKSFEWGNWRRRNSRDPTRSQRGHLQRSLWFLRVYEKYSRCWYSLCFLCHVWKGNTVYHLVVKNFRKFQFYSKVDFSAFPTLVILQHLMKTLGNRCWYNEKCRPNSLWHWAQWRYHKSYFCHFWWWR